MARPKGIPSKRRNKTYEQIFGNEKANEIRKIISKPKRDSSKMGKYIRTNEWRNKMSKRQKGKTYKELFGEDMAKIKSKNHSIIMKNKHKIKDFGFKKGEHIGKDNYFYGKIHTKEFKDKQRITRQKSMLLNRQIPNIGFYEKEILDLIEPSIGFPIIRQYPVDGYFVDGYCPQRNIVFEVDERPKTKENDIERENYIKSKLNCSFVRIPIY